MTDHKIRFGYFLVPNADDPLIETGRRIERLGFDYVAIQDHPYQRRFVDTWALMAMIAASTETLRVFPDVANLPLRPPAVMAKTAASIDRLSGGRFELGLGAGGFWDAIEAYGGRRRSPGEALAALDEAITVIRKIWSDERNLRVDGDHYHLAGAKPGPSPAHDIGIWVGAYGPRALALTGRVADGWVPSFQGDTAKIAEMTRRIDDSLAAAGRSEEPFRRILNVPGTITDGPSDGPFHGPVSRWLEDLEEFATSYGFDTFVFSGGGDDQLVRFAEEVIPAARDQITSVRRPPPA